MEPTEDYKITSKSDTAYVARLRTLQNKYREEHAQTESGWEPGRGPSKNSPCKYGNMLKDGERTGHNFLCKETFIYAKERVEHKRKNETISPYRLYCNMLSSQPMAFNLFHPLMRMLDDESAKPVLVLVFQKIFQKLDIADVYSIDLEYIPAKSELYLGDKTAMDAVIRYVDSEGTRNFIAVETKYTDSLGTNEASRPDIVARAKAIGEELGQFAYAPDKYSQLYRNYLLSERVRELGDKVGGESQHYKDCYTWILAPRSHPSTQREITHLLEHLKPEYRYKAEALAGICLEDFVDGLIEAEGMKEEYRRVFEEFRRRYLTQL